MLDTPRAPVLVMSCCRSTICLAVGGLHLATCWLCLSLAGAHTLHCAPPWGPSYLSRPHPLPFMMPPSSVAECVVTFTSALAGLMVAAGPERIQERRVAPLPGTEASELVRGPACRVTAHTHSVRAAEAWVSGAVTVGGRCSQ